MPQPKLLSKPWAADGLKNSIPVTRNGSLAQEAATYAEGFPNITMTPISVGGKPPSGKDMNGILHEISAHTVWQNQGGRYRFDQAFCDAIGGYPKGAVLINDASDTEYISLVDANTHNPNSGNNTGKWAVHAGKGLKASTTQAGIVQLSSATNSDREDMAATPKAVKAAYDKAVEAVANDLPSGAVMYFAGQTAPAGWLKADGAAVSRTTYAALFAAIGTTYGAGDGRNTFNLPDLRAEFVRGWDDGRGVDSERAFGSAQGHAVANHYHPTGVFWSDNDDLTMPRETEYGNKTSMQAGDPAAVVLGASQGGANQKNYHLDANLANNKGSGNNWTLTTRTDHMTVAQGGGETRPRNIALLACIKI